LTSGEDAAVPEDEELWPDEEEEARLEAALREADRALEAAARRSIGTQVIAGGRPGRLEGVYPAGLLVRRPGGYRECVALRDVRPAPGSPLDRAIREEPFLGADYAMIV
jgi:hypothetical protein